VAGPAEQPAAIMGHVLACIRDLVRVSGERAKLALAFAVDYADGGPVLGDDLLLGMLRVPDSVASHVLTQHGVTIEAAEACRTGNRTT
jgi:Clp amino terminal domain, pathogenicity island component